MHREVAEGEPLMCGLYYHFSNLCFKQMLTLNDCPIPILSNSFSFQVNCCRRTSRGIPYLLVYAIINFVIAIDIVHISLLLLLLLYAWLCLFIFSLYIFMSPYFFRGSQGAVPVTPCAMMTWVYIYIYIHTYIHIHVHVHVHIYIHTHIHIHIHIHIYV